MDHLGLVEAVDGFGESVVIGISEPGRLRGGGHVGDRGDIPFGS
jgi:hypothetical protein